MTTLRIEVGRFGATAEEVADWIERAPGTVPNRLDVEIDPDACAYVSIEEVQQALEARGIAVELVPWPEPPPLPWWRYPLSWPRRVYYWARRVILRETTEEQLTRILMGAYADSGALHAAATRESPLLRRIEKESGETFTLRGSQGFAGRELAGPGNFICYDCGELNGDHRPDCEAAVWNQPPKK